MNGNKDYEALAEKYGKLLDMYQIEKKQRLDLEKKLTKYTEENKNEMLFLEQLLQNLEFLIKDDQYSLLISEHSRQLWVKRAGELSADYK